jgi:hypothetical protein
LALRRSRIRFSPRTPDKLATAIRTDAGHVHRARRTKRTFVGADVRFPIRGDLSAALLAGFFHFQRHCYFQLIAMIPEEFIVPGGLARALPL